MKIKRFVGKKIYNQLNFDAKFNDDLTLMTGINGSGKTTVINFMMSLLRPSLKFLIKTKFKSVELRLKQEGVSKHIVLSAIKNVEKLILTSSKSNDDFEIDLTQFRSLKHQRPFNDFEQEIIQEYEIAFRKHKLFEVIESIPTPIFLGLDRKVLDFELETEHRLRLLRARRAAHDRHSKYSSKFVRETAIYNAIELAENEFNKTDKKKDKLEFKLRNDLLLSAISYSSVNKTFGSFQIDNEQLLFLSKNREDFTDTFHAIGIDRTKITDELDPFFNWIEEIIPIDEELGGLENSNIVDLMQHDKYGKLIMEWFGNSPQFNRLMSNFDLVGKFIEKRDELNNEINAYLNNVNRFLEDSNKSICFNPLGNLIVERDGKEVNIDTLSSGESQMLIMLTYLSFTTFDERSIFIVDEPELSLHVRWQEQFVDALIEANPQIQIILATHSPSIILDRVNHCIDLSYHD